MAARDRLQGYNDDADSSFASAVDESFNTADLTVVEDEKEAEIVVDNDFEVVEAETNAAMVNYDVADGTDVEGVDAKLHQINKLAFNRDDLPFFFAQYEDRIEHLGVKSQLKKRTTLVNILPLDG